MKKFIICSIIVTITLLPIFVVSGTSGLYGSNVETVVFYQSANNIPHWGGSGAQSFRVTTFRHAQSHFMNNPRFLSTYNEAFFQNYFLIWIRAGTDAGAEYWHITSIEDVGDRIFIELTLESAKKRGTYLIWGPWGSLYTFSVRLPRSFSDRRVVLSTVIGDTLIYDTDEEFEEWRELRDKRLSEWMGYSNLFPNQPLPEQENSNDEAITDNDDCDEDGIYINNTDNLDTENAQISVTLNGTPIQFLYAEPIMIEDRTLVPFRAIFEALDTDVEWDDETRTAIGTRDDITIEIPIDSTIATVNGEEVELDVPAMIHNERTLVPLRFIAEASGAEVEWNDATRTVTISIN